MLRIPTYTIEIQYLSDIQGQLIAGMDEAGRGPLAGPVVAAAVILNPAKIGKYRSKTKWWAGVRDSKVLSARKREALVDFIKDNSLDHSVGIASNHEIDELNIHHATFLAMRRALENLKTFPEMLLIDGKFALPGISNSKQVAIVDGDAKVLSISAASVLAKVYRDDLMRKYAQDFPEYYFDKHKGYPTLFHRKRLMRYGACSIHRMSFETVKDIVNKRFEKLLK